MPFPKIPLPGNKVLTGHTPNPAPQENPTLLQRFASRFPLKIRERIPAHENRPPPRQNLSLGSVARLTTANVQATDLAKHNNSATSKSGDDDANVRNVEQVVNDAALALRKLKAPCMLTRSEANAAGYFNHLKNRCERAIHAAVTHAPQDSRIDENDALLVFLYRACNADINPIWRRGDADARRLLEPLKQEMMRAFEKLPKFEGPVFRYADSLDGTHDATTSMADIRKLEANGGITFHGVTSTAKNKDFMMRKDRQVHYYINSVSGRALGPYLGNDSADEVVFVDGARLDLLKWEFRDGSSATDPLPKFNIYLQQKA